MPDFAAYAPGKVILLGEHAVVYGQPALAVPVQQVRVRVQVSPGLGLPSGMIRIEAPSLSLNTTLAELPAQNPLATAINLTLDHLNSPHPPACTIRITSTIPVAAGLGSGAAVSVALIRALSAFLGRSLPDQVVSALAYEVEKIHHGTPSGIDNTVITYAKPVYFQKARRDPENGNDHPPRLEILIVEAPFTLVIADSGITSPTAAAVGAVRSAWQAAPIRFEGYFSQIGSLVNAARVLIESGWIDKLGTLMNTNHILLQQLGVSCIELDDLVEAALSAGALGAKLSGGGRGGNMIALVPFLDGDIGAQQVAAERIAADLRLAGAVNTLVTTITPAQGDG
jgi:mevalonate kinase